jgi:hypothetical protein
MLPLENGGVVDSTLKVYGTEGLRVVDASGMHNNFFRTLTTLTNLWQSYQLPSVRISWDQHTP